MRRTWFATCCTGVIVVNITTVGVTVVPILPPFVGIGRTNILLLTTACTAIIYGWLLWETRTIALTATVALVVVGEGALLLSGGIAAAWGCWPTCMQSWMFESWFCIATRLLAWLFMVSCVAANTAPKFASKSPYEATNTSSSIMVIL